MYLILNQMYSMETFFLIEKKILKKKNIFVVWCVVFL